MGIEENKAAIRRFLSQEVFFGAEDNLAVVDEVFAPNVVFLGPDPEGEPQVEGAQAIELIKGELNGYQNGEIAILEQIAEGESVATRYTLEVGGDKYTGVTFSRFADDKIQEYSVLVGEYANWFAEKRAHN
jgi:SnoaL-like domain